MPEVQCFACGKTVNKEPRQLTKWDKSFCSHKCRASYYNVGGEHHHAWNGGKYEHHKYVMIHSPNHPNASMRGYMLEHRLVMEEKLGRFLEKRERVHHIDHDTTNNNPDNLMLFESQSAHISHEFAQKRHTKYVSLRCAKCGKRFDRLLSHMKGKKQYCSEECRLTSYVPPLRTLITVTCPVCGKSFERQKKRVKSNSCCSHSCATTLLNRRRLLI